MNVKAILGLFQETFEEWSKDKASRLSAFIYLPKRLIQYSVPHECGNRYIKELQNFYCKTVEYDG
jgi:hypothetical protein